ncbi:putative toxin-antitoxin system toxin component, PIN family [bacterium]|nr:putative toxin-antitoxin system toxin component, PIN family [bacterium]
MRLIVDTNVFISGIFFSGPPYDILNAWRHRKVEMVISSDILDEYRRVGEELAKQYPGIDMGPILELLAIKARIFDAPPLDENVCSDPDDDKFIACAIASRTKLICSGDKALLRTSGYQGITVLKPKDFVDIYLEKKR